MSDANLSFKIKEAGNYAMYKLEIKTFKLRINNEQAIEFREKRKRKIQLENRIQLRLCFRLTRHLSHFFLLKFLNQ